MNERYKKYYTALLGKLTADQFLKRFQGKKDNNKYTSIMTETDKYWILNTTKVICAKFKWLDGEKTQIEGSLYYSLYMNKSKDMAVLKAPIMGFSMASRYDVDNNIRAYFSNMLKKMGYTKFEFDLNNRIKFGKYSSHTMCPTKVLIPTNKTEDDLANLMLIIDRLNDYIRSHPYGYWEDAKSIHELVKFNPAEPSEEFELEDDVNWI